MLLEQEHQKFEMSGTEKPKHFTVNEGSKLFSVLFDKLYSNKIAAVIRELSTNAFEIHQVCGKEGEPFLVKLPSWLDSNFSIRDYGTGLTPSQIEKVYTCVFESTKDGDNSLGGAFGLGSKTPFAYINSFVINSYVNGTKYSYFFIKDATGCPSYSLADTSKTTEPNGLEICIAVNKNDINSFVKTAQDVYRWFKHQPKVVGNNNYVPVVKPTPTLTGDKWEYYSGSFIGPVAVMGNISYALNNFPTANKFLINGMVLYFEIGEISPAPNRETLSFDKATIDNITKRLGTIEDVIQKNIEDKIAKCDNFWAAAIEARKLNGTFNISKVTYDGENVIGPIQFPTTNGVKETELIVVHRKTSTEVRYSVNPGSTNESYMPKFYVDDLARGGITRIKNVDKAKYSYSDNWYCKLADVDKFKKNLRLKDDMITLTSTLPKPVYASRAAGNSHKTKVMELIGGRTSATFCWADREVDLEEDEGYYVEISNNKVKCGTINDIHPCYIYPIAVANKMTIYGVKTAVISKLGDGWENAIDILKKAAIKSVASMNPMVDNEITLRQMENSRSRMWTNISHIVKKFPGKNEITDLYDEYQALKKTVSSNQKNLENLRETQRFLVEISSFTRYNGNVDKKKIADVEAISKKFPLLNIYIDDAKELFYYCSYILQKGR